MIIKKILVTGARAPVAIDLGRAFSAYGAQVYFADSIFPWGAKFSSAGAVMPLLPSPRFQFEAFAVKLKKND